VKRSNGKGVDRLRSVTRGRGLMAAALIAGLIASTGGALAQNGIGAQITSMSTEFATAGGNAGQMAMYIAALICFIGGAWFLWQSRHPENRESGKVAAGLAGLVLTGLFATGAVWVGKAAQTVSGAGPTDTNGQGTVTFQ
jgi:mannitol-specific phosphotransferase system IIBC component